MHYIVGTTIQITETAEVSQAGRSITDLRSRRRRVQNNTPFTPMIEYTLYNIRKNGELFEYKFSDPQGNIIDLQFEATQHADNYIANIRNEVVPDYEEYHRNSRS